MTPQDPDIRRAGVVIGKCENIITITCILAGETHRIVCESFSRPSRWSGNSSEKHDNYYLCGTLVNLGIRDDGLWLRGEVHDRVRRRSIRLHGARTSVRGHGGLKTRPPWGIDGVAGVVPNPPKTMKISTLFLSSAFVVPVLWRGAFAAKPLLERFPQPRHPGDRAVVEGEAAARQAAERGCRLAR